MLFSTNRRANFSLYVSSVNRILRQCLLNDEVIHHSVYLYTTPGACTAKYISMRVSK